MSASLSVSQRAEAQDHEGAQRAKVSAAGVRRQRNEDCWLLPLVDHIQSVYVRERERERERTGTFCIISELVCLRIIIRFSASVICLLLVIWPLCSLSQPTFLCNCECNILCTCMFTHTHTHTHTQTHV